MSRTVQSYVDGLITERVSVGDFREVINGKIFMDILENDDHHIVKLTDTLYYATLDTDYGNYQETLQQFVETAYEDMVVVFDVEYLDASLYYICIKIYLFDGDSTWIIIYKEPYLYVMKSLLEIVKNNLVGHDPNFPRYKIEELILLQNRIGNFLKLAEPYSKRFRDEFMERLVLRYPIILPAPLEDFEGKIPQAFTYNPNVAINQAMDVEDFMEY